MSGYARAGRGYVSLGSHLFADGGSKDFDVPSGIVDADLIFTVSGGLDGTWGVWLGYDPANGTGDTIWSFVEDGNTSADDGRKVAVSAPFPGKIRTTRTTTTTGTLTVTLLPRIIL